MSPRDGEWCSSMIIIVILHKNSLFFMAGQESVWKSRNLIKLLAMQVTMMWLLKCIILLHFFFCTTWDWQNCFSQILVSSCARGRQKEQRFNFNIVSSRWFVSGIVCVHEMWLIFHVLLVTLVIFNYICSNSNSIMAWHLKMKGKGLKIVWRNFWGVQNCELHVRRTDWWP